MNPGRDTYLGEKHLLACHYIKPLMSTVDLGIAAGCRYHDIIILPHRELVRQGLALDSSSSPMDLETHVSISTLRILVVSIYLSLING